MQEEDYTPPAETMLEPEEQQEEVPIEDVEVVMATTQTGLSMADFDKHLKSTHLKGKALQLTISAIGRGTFGKPMKKADDLEIIAGAAKIPQREKTPVMFFAEITKMLHLSNTNRTRLMELFGDDPAQWLGKTVILQSEMQKVGKKTEYPVRVQVERSKAANASKKPPTQQRQPRQLMAQKDASDIKALFGVQPTIKKSNREYYGELMQEAEELGLKAEPIGAGATEAEIIAAGKLLRAIVEQAKADKAKQEQA